MQASKTLAHAEPEQQEALEGVSTRVRESLLERARIACAKDKKLTLQKLFDEGLELRLEQLDSAQKER